MQQFKATDKVTQKMTRDGAVETNKATGEQTRTSKRERDSFQKDTASGAGEDAASEAAGEAFDRAAG